MGGSDCAGDSDSSGFSLYSRRSSSAESWSLGGFSDGKKKVGDAGPSVEVEMEDSDAGLEMDPDTSDDDEGSEWNFVSRKEISLFGCVSYSASHGCFGREQVGAGRGENS